MSFLVAPADTRRADRRFSRLTAGAATLTLLVVVAIAVFLALRAAPAFRSAGLHFFSRKVWFPDNPKPDFGIGAMVFGTVASSLVALVIATPIAVGAALFLTELAPARLGTLGGYLLDMLAAVPSVVYGLWAIFVLAPDLAPVERVVNAVLGFIPVFHDRQGAYGSSSRSIFLAGVVLAIMILP